MITPWDKKWLAKQAVLKPERTEGKFESSFQITY